MGYRDLDHDCPRDYLAPGEEWPTGELVEGADPEAHFAKAIAFRLGEFLKGEKKREVATRANVSPQTLYAVLNGTTWGDVISIQRLETALQQRLWINEELPKSVESEWPWRIKEGTTDVDARLGALMPWRDETDDLDDADLDDS